MKLKSKLISTAVVAAFGAAAGTAQAVNLGEDGQGQVLIYPFYTVQAKGTNNADTYVTIVNSDTARGKAVKVRFIEGKASQEVLDFNLYLSPNDMWTGAITRDRSGNPVLATYDKSCTAPEIQLTDAATGRREAPFVNYAYAGDAVADSSLTRAKEGYVEVIQMADLVAGQATASGFQTYAAALHAGGTPANCAGIRSTWLAGGYSTATDGVSAPTGTLSGYGTILNSGEGTDITYDAVAIENYNGSGVANHQAPGSIKPDLGDVSPKISYVLNGNTIVRTDWNAAIAAGIQPVVPVSAVIDRNQIINEYAIAAAPVGLGTDWVVTFPTKRLHLAAAAVANRAPFTSTLGTSGACETIGLTAYDREEGVVTSGLIFSPPPPSGTNSLCWEANVVSLSNGGTTSNVVPSTNVRTTLPMPFAEGWLRLSFAQSVTDAVAGQTSIWTLGTGAPVTSGTVVTYTGLPVVGFMAQSFVNTGTVANYGGTSTHRYNRSIQ